MQKWLPQLLNIPRSSKVWGSLLEKGPAWHADKKVDRLKTCGAVGWWQIGAGGPRNQMDGRRANRAGWVARGLDGGTDRSWKPAGPVRGSELTGWVTHRSGVEGSRTEWIACR